MGWRNCCMVGLFRVVGRVVRGFVRVAPELEEGRRLCRIDVARRVFSPDPEEVRFALKVIEAAKSGASLVVLPECFNSPYGCQYFPKYAEKVLPSPSIR